MKVGNYEVDISAHEAIAKAIVNWRERNPDVEVGRVTVFVHPMILLRAKQSDDQIEMLEDLYKL